MKIMFLLLLLSSCTLLSSAKEEGIDIEIKPVPVESKESKSPVSEAKSKSLQGPKV
jgi:hypothetical protein